jgi:PX domain
VLPLQEPWFDVHITAAQIGGEQCTTRLRKAWSEFSRLHYLLLTDTFGCDEAVKAAMPPLPQLQAQHVQAVAQGLTAYFAQLLDIPAVAHSPMFTGFLGSELRSSSSSSDAAGLSTAAGATTAAAGPTAAAAAASGNGSGGIAAAPLTAIGFLLQPFEPHSVYVPRRSEYTRELSVLKVRISMLTFILHTTVATSACFTLYALLHAARMVIMAITLLYLQTTQRTCAVRTLHMNVNTVLVALHL